MTVFEKAKKFIEFIIFQSKWLLIPFYLVLICTLGVYTYFDVASFVEFIEHINILDKEGAMLTFIELIDIAMIANLGKMIITGSYNSFISKSHNNDGENIGSGMLKVNMATSMVGITSIGILAKSVHVADVPWETLYKLGYVHCIFLLSSIVLEVVDYMHCKLELKESEHEHKVHMDTKVTGTGNLEEHKH